jgi:hypothetical protein
MSLKNNEGERKWLLGLYPITKKVDHSVNRFHLMRGD